MKRQRWSSVRADRELIRASRNTVLAMGRLCLGVCMGQGEGVGLGCCDGGRGEELLLTSTTCTSGEGSTCSTQHIQVNSKVIISTAVTSSPVSLGEASMTTYSGYWESTT